jgi:hypothetical protein
MENTSNGQVPATPGPAMGNAVDAAASHMPSAGMIATGIVSGLAVTAITATGRKLIGTLAKSPLLMFSAGLAAGYFAHKHRQEILDTVNDAAERGKTFVLQQREQLEDLLAESREAEEESSSDAPQP